MLSEHSISVVQYPAIRRVAFITLTPSRRRLMVTMKVCSCKVNADRCRREIPVSFAIGKLDKYRAVNFWPSSPRESLGRLYVAKLIIRPYCDPAFNPIRTQPLDHNTLRGHVNGSDRLSRPRIWSIAADGIARERIFISHLESSDYLWKMFKCNVASWFLVATIFHVTCHP